MEPAKLAEPVAMFLWSDPDKYEAPESTPSKVGWMIAQFTIPVTLLIAGSVSGVCGVAPLGNGE